jgi:hypothetical protein
VSTAAFAAVLALLFAFAAFQSRANQILMRTPIRTRDVLASDRWRIASVVAVVAAAGLVAFYALHSIEWSRS